MTSLDVRLVSLADFKSALSLCVAIVPADGVVRLDVETGSVRLIATDRHTFVRAVMPPRQPALAIEPRYLSASSAKDLLKRLTASLVRVSAETHLTIAGDALVIVVNAEEPLVTPLEVGRVAYPDLGGILGHLSSTTADPMSSMVSLDPVVLSKIAALTPKGQPLIIERIEALRAFRMKWETPDEALVSIATQERR